MTPISCGDMSSEMYLDIEVYLSEYLQSGQVYHGVCLYGTTAGYGAGADTNISIYNRWRAESGSRCYRSRHRKTSEPNVSNCNNNSAKPGLTVTDLDRGISPRLQSPSVTSWAPKPHLLLQIETFKIRRKVCLDL